MFAPFNEIGTFSQNGTYFNNPDSFRTFEELISERGEDVFPNQIEPDINYNVFFEKIRNKLFKVNQNLDVNVHEFKDIKEFKEIINNLKKEICESYIALTKSENNMKNATEKYTSFCENIKSSVESIVQCGVNDESDKELINSLEKKIEIYYEKLNIPLLTEKYETDYTNFEKIKYKISSISGTVIPQTTCQICLENQVEYFIDPCGHTICKNCKLRCENSTSCHYCRTTKKCYKRLYL